MKIIEEEWNEAAELMLAPLAADDPLDGVAGWRLAVEKGDVALLHVVGNDGSTIGRCLVEVLTLPGGRRFHLMAGVGADPDRPLTQSLLPHLEQRAAALGCTEFEISTARPGLVRILKRRGYREHRKVMRYEL